LHGDAPKRRVLYQAERERPEKKYAKEAVVLAREIRAISEKADGELRPTRSTRAVSMREDEEELATQAAMPGAPEPREHDNVRDLLWRWGLVPCCSRTGSPSTSNLAIRTHLADAPSPTIRGRSSTPSDGTSGSKTSTSGTYIRKAGIADVDSRTSARQVPGGNLEG
jgi:hypothetical protein